MAPSGGTARPVNEKLPSADETYWEPIESSVSARRASTTATHGSTGVTPSATRTTPETVPV